MFKGKIKKRFLLVTILPLFLIGIVSISLTISRFISFSNEENSINLYNSASTVATTFDQLYKGDYELKEDGLYKGNIHLNGRIELFDVLKESTELEYSLFCGNTRVSTTITDNNGNYILDSSLNPEIYEEIISTQKPCTEHISINGNNYFSCYYPIVGRINESNQGIVGIVGIAKSNSAISENQTRIIIPLIVVMSALILLTGIMSLTYSTDITNCINKLQEFVYYISQEEFEQKLDDKVYNRDDELGDIGRDITGMRNVLQDMIELDGLTKLYNKRTGNKKFEALRARCEYNKQPFSLAIGDIDFFKKVNDTYGHEAGDEVLKKIASIIKKEMKGYGFVARWGGEEFMLGFEAIGKEDAYYIIEKALNRIRKTVVHYNNMDIRVTMTFGLVLGRKSKTSEEIFNTADHRLYIGKENGRNQIVYRG